MVVQGDAGINFYGNWRDEHVKNYLDTLPISFLFLHGNHEMRPESIPTYQKTYSAQIQGYVYREDRHPSLNFAVDGETYLLDGNRVLVCGGAYSVDKEYRLLRSWSWWPDEQPSDAIKLRVEEEIAKQGGEVDYVLTHTCPLRFQPTEVFLPMIDQSKVDKSTEIWLDSIYDKVACKTWFCGHFHVDKKDNNVRFMYEDIISLSLPLEGGECYG